MKSPHRQGGRGAIIRRHPDGHNPSRISEQPQRGKPTRQAKWQARNPKARWAHVALQSALRRGLIERQPCEVCGETTVDGHHPDYNRPMDVVWLCRKHHKATHRQEGGR